MRAVAIVMTLGALTIGGCSLLFDGNDLKGKNGGGGDMSAGGSGGNDDMAGGGGGGAGSGGGGGTAMCAPKTTVKFNVTHPTVGAGSPSYVTLADINGDGKDDLVTSNYTDGNFSVLLGDGKGGFTLAPTTPIASCANPFEVVARDLTGDNKPDLVITCWDQTTAHVNAFVNTSTTTTVSFSAPHAVTLPSTGAYYYPAVGKFSSSTHPGLALVGNDAIYLFDGVGDGTFTTGPKIAAGMGADSAAVGDVNGDGIDDIVAYNNSDYDMTLALSHTGAAYTTTTLAFDATADMTTPGQVYYGSTPILVDYNSDGLMDIVIASGTSQPGEIYMFKNSGTTTAPVYPVFATQVAVGDEPLVVGMADFNCDGTLDIVAASNGCQSGQGCTGGPELWLLPGHGTGFDARQTSVIDPYCDSFAIADFNGDGYLDIACGGGSTTPNSINLLLSTP